VAVRERERSSPPPPSRHEQEIPLSGDQLDADAQIRNGDATDRDAVVGSWLGTVTEEAGPAPPTFALLLTFAPGGVLMQSDQRQVGEVGEEAMLTAGHGVWQALSNGQFRARFTKFGGRPQQGLFAVIRHELTGSVDSSGQTLRANGSLHICAAATGDVLATVPVRMEATRLHA
jgi:hypothetical protein